MTSHFSQHLFRRKNKYAIYTDSMIRRFFRRFALPLHGAICSLMNVSIFDLVRCKGSVTFKSCTKKVTSKVVIAAAFKISFAVGVGFSFGLWAPGKVRRSLLFACTFDFVAVNDNTAFRIPTSFILVSNFRLGIISPGPPEARPGPPVPGSRPGPEGHGNLTLKFKPLSSLESMEPAIK